MISGAGGARAAEPAHPVIAAAPTRQWRPQEDGDGGEGTASGCCVGGDETAAGPARLRRGNAATTGMPRTGWVRESPQERIFPMELGNGVPLWCVTTLASGNTGLIAKP